MWCLLLAITGFFSVNGDLIKNGFTEGKVQEEDSFLVQDGVLKCHCSPNPMKGASFSKEIEFPKTGELSYEVKLFVHGHTDRFVLQVCLGQLMMSFAGTSMVRYYPVPGAKGPNWRNVAKGRFKHGEWTKVRLRWNTEKRIIKYYVGEDQEVPSYVEREVMINPGKGGKYFLSLGNYGLHADHEEHHLRNFEIKAIDEAAERAKIKRDTAIVFKGLCSEYFPIEEWTKDFAADRIKEFTLEYDGYNYTMANWLSLSGCPDEDLCARTKLIILCDMSLEKRVLPYESQEYLLDAVRGGARMLVTGGFVGLQRCGDFNSPIAKALPCKFKNVFDDLPEAKYVTDYGKGKISVLNKRKLKEPCINQ